MGRPAPFEPGIVQGEAGGEILGLPEDPFQFMPPEMLPGSDPPRADEKGRRHPGFFQDGERLQRIVRVTVVEGYGHGGLRKVIPVFLEPDQTHRIPQVVHLRSEVFRRNGKHLGIAGEAGYPVVGEDDHRRVDAVEQTFAGGADEGPERTFDVIEMYGHNRFEYTKMGWRN